MNLRDIAFFSLRRQKGKKAFVLIAMALGCATVISLFTFVDTQKKSIENQFDQYGANIIILPKSDNLGLTYGGINVSGVVANLREIRLTDIDRIWQIPNRDNIRAVSPKLLGAVQAENGNGGSQVLLIGVYFQEELRIKSWWEITGGVPIEPDGIIVGSEVAQRMEITPGESLFIEGRKFTVSGVLGSTGSQDDNVIFADFQLVSTLIGQDGVVSLAEVSALCSDCPIEQITQQLSTILPDANVKEIKQIMTQKMETVKQFERFTYTVVLVMVAIGAVLIFTSMMGSVSERTQEIGVFRAVGYKQVHIITIILIEAFVLSLVAGIVGTFSGFLISYTVLPNVIDIGREMISIDLSLGGAGIPAVVLLGLASTLYPAVKASRIDPVIAINSL